VNGFHSAYKEPERALNIARLLLPGTELDASFFMQFRGPEEAFTLFQQSSQPPYYDWSLTDRAKIAISLAETRVPNITSNLFKIAVSRDILQLHSYRVQDAAGRSLLHGVAGALGIIASRISKRAKRMRPRVILKKPDFDLEGMRASF
jgi:hypothetical protein